MLTYIPEVQFVDDDVVAFFLSLATSKLCRGAKLCALSLTQAATTANGTEVHKLFQEGVQQYRRGDYPKALVTYQRVLEIRRQQQPKLLQVSAM